MAGEEKKKQNICNMANQRRGARGKHEMYSGGNKYQILNTPLILKVFIQRNK